MITAAFCNELATSEARNGAVAWYSYERLCFLSLYNESVRGNHEACQIRWLDYPR